MPPTIVQVIYTFYEQGQLQDKVQLASLTEKCLLDTVFEGLNKDELQQLLKLSCAFEVDKLPAFAAKNNGKYYFNVESNADLETVSNCERKHKALKERLKK